ncbi:MAG: DUF2807 domain-containing protein [Flavobacteriaceae bacterium]|nr:DUF2807 domain-containing protein [Flavobacteriaceae bacterium]
MRSIYILIIVVMLSGCNSENAWDCIQTAGPIVEYEVEVADFERIFVNRDVELILSQGAEFNVTVRTGKNLVSDIDIRVSGNQLRITDNNTCNLVREYGITQVYVTAPQLTEIRNSSQYEVSSTGVLSYDDIILTSEDFNVPGSFNVGDFRLELDCDAVQIIANGRSSYFLTGTVNNLFIGFFSGDGRFEGESLLAEHIEVFHRGSNDMIVNPQQSLSGALVSTGNLISVNVPPLVDVDVLYTGQLIFED